MIYIILTILYIQLTHFVADFIMQTHEMSINKSTNVYWLNRHILSYGKTMFMFSIPFLLIVTMFGGVWAHLSVDIIAYIFINMALHWVTDYFTSQQVRKYFDIDDFHNGFVIIGLDQLTHTTCLILTYFLMFL